MTLGGLVEVRVNWPGHPCYLKKKIACEGCHINNVNTPFVYPLNLLTARAYMCHDRNIRSMIESKKSLRMILPDVEFNRNFFFFGLINSHKKQLIISNKKKIY